MVDKKFGYGIIGCGTISKWHAEAAAATGKYNLVAVTDVRKEAAQKFAEQFHCVAEESTEALLSREDIEIVSICTPSGFHAIDAIKAAKAGKHVIVEKPMAITHEQINDILKACAENNVKMQVISQMRFKENVLKTKQAIESGKLGKLVLGDVSMKYFRSQEYYDTGGWRGTWKLDGGGALMNQGIHGIDTLQFLMGPIKSVYALAKTLARIIEVEDTAVADVEYENGAIGTITGATSVYPGIPRRFEINGTEGSIVLTEDTITLWEIKGEPKVEIEEKKRGMNSSSDPTAFGIEGHVLQFEDMADALINNREPKVNQYEGKKPVEIILAIYESEKTGKKVYL
ncbi:MAG: Gfo/Idh/MocA family oxidoreductase [Clostridiaceae bacterium]|nr:Gfo/Idh/MocA family oxidoreductase [Clostridiaceae bacterium]